MKNERILRQRFHTISMRRGDIVDLGIFLFGVPGVVLILNGYLFGSFLFLLSVFMIFARDMTNNILERIGL